MRIVCISDTHERDYSVPDGDVLIHSGDLTFHGGVEELHIDHDWGFQNQYHKVALFLGPITYTGGRTHRLYGFEGERR